MAKHVSVRGGLDGVVFFLVCGNEVAVRVEVHFLSALEFALSEKLTTSGLF
jgi:hypothetical protein